jgi:hypothetical protein
VIMAANDGERKAALALASGLASGRKSLSSSQKTRVWICRRDQAQGQARAKAAGAYRGRPKDTNATPASLRSGMSGSSIQAATIVKVAKRAAQAAGDEPLGGFRAALFDRFRR